MALSFPKQAKCRWCGQSIDFAVTLTGKRMPLDPIIEDRTGDPLAQYALYEDPVTGIDRIHYIREDDPLEGEERLVRSHFATCKPKSRAGRPHTRRRAHAGMGRAAA